MLRFLPTVLIPHGVALLLVIILAVASLMFTNSSMVNLSATIAQLWLTLNLGAISGSGEVISALPTLPGLIFLWALAVRIHRAVKVRVSIADLGVLAALVVGIPLTLTIIAAFMLFDASSVLNVNVAPAVLLLRTLLFHLSALFLGMGPRLWQALARRYGAPEWLIDAITQAFRFLIAFATVSVVIVIAMVAINHSAFTATLSGYDDTTSVLALITMSILYLPNIVIFAMGILIGSPLYFGDASISVFSVHTVPLPPLPILAALPSEAPSWAVSVLVIPAIIATWVCVRNPMKLAVNATAAAIAAVCFLVLAVFAGGTLGVYNYVGLNVFASLGLVLGYFLIVGLLIAGIDKLRNPVVVKEVEPEPVVPEVEEAEAEPEPAKTEDEDAEPVEEAEETEEEIEEEPDLEQEEPEEESKSEETNDGSEAEER
ncbi:cell division protein PerM [Corynebacterium suranareeae]|uniref:cell division protein PerM n=1 Tax=Corynebacterium suranareeae TaxID=2506452 RepID=UPI000BBB27FE